MPVAVRGISACAMKTMRRGILKLGEGFAQCGFDGVFGGAGAWGGDHGGDEELAEFGIGQAGGDGGCDFRQGVEGGFDFEAGRRWRRGF